MRGSKHVNKAVRVGQPCKCGCGQPVPQAPGAGRPRAWINEHKPSAPPAEPKNCECGCGLPIVRMKSRGALPKFFPGHSPSAKKFPTRNKVP